ncbi:MAG: hypothetical protein ACKVX7_01880 [Planctomycetota bacterium]
MRYNSALCFLPCLLLPCWLSGCLIPEGTTPVARINTQFASQYNHRGMVENERGVWQSELRTDLADRFGGAVQFGAWGNLDLGDSVGDAWFPKGHGGKFTEVDLTAAYARQVGGFDLRGGVISYVLPDGSEFPNGVRGTTTEVFGVVGHEIPFGLYPSFRADIDWDEVDGYYLNTAIERALALPPIDPVRALVKLSLGYSDDNHSDWTYGLDESGFSDLRAAGTLFYDYNANTTFSLGLAASTILDDDLRDWFELIDISPDNVWITTGVGFTF